ncbi:hypothetical protein SETIT_9G356000v2 [Setaria italica]|uniref:Uncharacterized protein n=1 Tax=Setaria italica TaxID=4555 RepID=A0A368SPD0_SETIT|nr:hypothetical protein SETIT_9G356000v2 [Setaria italica]
MLPLTGVHESPGKTKFRIPAKRNLIVAIAALIGQLFIHLINFSHRCRHFRCCTPLHCYGFPHRGRLRSGGSRGRGIRRSRPHSRPLVPLARMAGVVCCWDGRTGLLHFSRAGHYAVGAAT